MTPQHSTGAARADTRAAGVLMLASAVISIVFVALDPEVAATTSRAILEGFVANGPLHRAVHAVELACVLGLALGFTSLAARLGTQRPAVRGATIAYLAGSLAMVAAAVTDGFISADVASYYLRAGHSVDTGREMIHLVYVVVQDFAAVAWLLQSTGVLAMAGTMLREGGLPRIVGVLGLVSGLVPPIAIVATWPVMDGGVVIGVLLAQLVWNVAASAFLMRRAPRGGDSRPERQAGIQAPSTLRHAQP